MRTTLLGSILHFSNTQGTNENINLAHGCLQLFTGGMLSQLNTEFPKCECKINILLQL